MLRVVVARNTPDSVDNCILEFFSPAFARVSVGFAIFFLDSLLPCLFYLHRFPPCLYLVHFLPRLLFFCLPFLYYPPQIFSLPDRFLVISHVFLTPLLLVFCTVLLLSLAVCLLENDSDMSQFAHGLSPRLG